MLRRRTQHHRSKHLRRRHEYCEQHPRQVNPRSAPIVGEDESSPEFVEAILHEIQNGGDSPGEDEREKRRGQIDRSARGGSGEVDGYGGGGRRWPEQGGGHGGDAIATGSPEIRVRRVRRGPSESE